MHPLPRGGVVVNVRSGAVFELNAVATEVWKLIGDGCSVRAICDRLQGRYAVERDRLESDIMTLLDSLTGRGLIAATLR